MATSNVSSDLHKAVVFYLENLIRDPKKLKKQFTHVMKELEISEKKYHFERDILPSLENCMNKLKQPTKLAGDKTDAKIVATLAKLIMVHPWITHLPEQNLCFRYLTLACLKPLAQQRELSQKPSRK